MATIDDVYTLLSSLNTFVNGTLAGNASSAANAGSRTVSTLGWSFGEWGTHTINSDLAAILSNLNDLATGLVALAVDVANTHDALNAIDLSPLAEIGTETDSFAAGQQTLFGVFNDVFRRV